MSQASGVDLVLASSSRTRASLLANAGLSIAVDPAAVDEAAAKESLRADGANVRPRQPAQHLVEPFFLVRSEPGQGPRGAFNLDRQQFCGEMRPRRAIRILECAASSLHWASRLIQTLFARWLGSADLVRKWQEP